MEIIKSGLRALWKILYPLMVYYLSVFAVGVIFQTWGIQTNTTIARSGADIGDPLVSI